MNSNQSYNIAPTGSDHQPGYRHLEASLTNIEAHIAIYEHQIEDQRTTMTIGQLGLAGALEYQVSGQGEPREDHVADWLSWSKNLPSGYYTATVNLTALRNEEQEALAALEPYIPEKTADIIAKLRQFEDRLDYDRLEKNPQLLLSFYDNIGDCSTVLRMLQAHAPQTYGKLLEIESILNPVIRVLEEQGYVKETAEPSGQVERIPRDVETVKSIAEYLDAMDNMRWDMYIKYDGGLNEFSTASLQAQSLARDLQSDHEVPSSSAEVFSRNIKIYNGRLWNALFGALVQFIDELPPEVATLDSNANYCRQRMEQLRHIDMRSALAGIELPDTVQGLPFDLSADVIRKKLLPVFLLLYYALFGRSVLWSLLRMMALMKPLVT